MNRANAAVEANPLTIVLVMTGRLRKDDIVSRLRALGHTVHNDFDTAISTEYDLSLSKNQARLKRLIATKPDFVFFSPPCLTASIAFEPPLRHVHHPEGVPGLSTELQALVDGANKLYDLVGECAQLYDDHDVAWAIESSASRRYGPARCRWLAKADNGFLWDYPKIARLDGHYLCYAQCAFQALWQKYTGLLVSRKAKAAFTRIFEPAQCNCKSHAIVLRGWDTDGVAKTRKAQEYTPMNCSGYR